jgi:hypothetical protein
MQEYFEVRSLTLLVLSLFLTGFLVSLIFIEYSNTGTILVIDGETILSKLNFSTTAKISDEKTLRIFFIQVFPNLSWKLLLNESFQLHEAKNSKINFLVRAADEKSLEILVNEKERFIVTGVENVKQSSFLVLFVYDFGNFVGK